MFGLVQSCGQSVFLSPVSDPMTVTIDYTTWTHLGKGDRDPLSPPPAAPRTREVRVVFISRALPSAVTPFSPTGFSDNTRTNRLLWGGIIHIS